MKSNLLQELEQIAAYEEQMKIPLPIPSYLFVQKYGRSIEDEMPQIAGLLGKKEWFIFKADSSQEKSLLNRFLVGFCTQRGRTLYFPIPGRRRCYV